MKIAKQLTEYSTFITQYVKTTQGLFVLSEPLNDYRFVIVSAADFTFPHEDKEELPKELTCETYIFGANSNGNMLNHSELPGSFKGELNIPKALKNAGYSVMLFSTNNKEDNNVNS